MNRLLLLLCVVILSGCQRAPKESIMAEVYYVPIGIETLIAMTEQNIHKHCQVCGKIQVDSADIKEMNSAILAAPDGEFDGLRVRVKLIYANGTAVLVDNEGGVRTPLSDAPKRISAEELEQVRRMIEGAAINN